MKVIAVDLDGTLLNSQNQIPGLTKNTLIKASKLGHKVVIISGRDYHACKFIGETLEFEKYGGLISSSNGANVYDSKNQKSIIDHYLDPDLVREMIDFGKSLGFDLIINKNGKILVEKKDTYSLGYLSKKNKMDVSLVENLKDTMDFRVHKVLFSKDPKIMGKNAPIFIEKFKDRVNPIHSMPQFLDIMPKGINKGRSLLEIADYYGIDHRDTLAFGDEVNDEDMIKMAGVGIAMGNANEKIKSLADHITLSNDEDGIGYYVEKYVLGG
ncbi:MAG: Cof-type HAD-IIB family hydrolase [Anaerococcus sp.]|nr:Cof-type HAD-IIB family hydrolase [Anaerococcus sp.]